MKLNPYIKNKLYKIKEKCKLTPNWVLAKTKRHVKTKHFSHNWRINRIKI